MDVIASILASFMALWEPSFHEVPPTPVMVEKPVMEKPVMVKPVMVKPVMEKPSMETYSLAIEGLPPRCDQYDPLFWKAANKHAPYGHELYFALLLNSMAFVESSCNPNAYNESSKAAGLMQFIPSTAAHFGIDPYDPEQAIDAAARYLAWLYGQWRAHDRLFLERIMLALPSYNWGLGNLLDLQKEFGCVFWDCFAPIILDIPNEETYNYGPKINDLAESGIE